MTAILQKEMAHTHTLQSNLIKHDLCTISYVMLQ